NFSHLRWYRSARHGIEPDFRSPVPEGLTIPSGDRKFYHGMELISDLLVLGHEGLKQAIAILSEKILP
ncbi:MAG: hypothetical protein ACREAR_02155, partial [Nitrosotalea sp.]